MSVFPYFVCVVLGVDSLRGDLAEGDGILKILFPLWSNFTYMQVFCTYFLLICAIAE